MSGRAVMTVDRRQANPFDHGHPIALARHTTRHLPSMTDIELVFETARIARLQPSTSAGSNPPVDNVPGVSQPQSESIPSSRRGHPHRSGHGRGRWGTRVGRPPAGHAQRLSDASASTFDPLLGGPSIQINEAPLVRVIRVHELLADGRQEEACSISPLTAHRLSAIVGGRGHDLSERPVIEVVPPGCRVGPRACSQR
jgi:hypothetical protein